MVTHQQLSELVDNAPPGKAVVYGMAAALIVALLDGETATAEAQRVALEAAGFTAIEIDQRGWEAKTRYHAIINEFGPLEVEE